MANVRDLMTPEDALEMEERYHEVIRERKEHEDAVGAGFREAQHRAVFDWEFDLPEDFFDGE